MKQIIFLSMVSLSIIFLALTWIGHSYRMADFETTGVIIDKDSGVSGSGGGLLSPGSINTYYTLKIKYKSPYFESYQCSKAYVSEYYYNLYEVGDNYDIKVHMPAGLYPVQLKGKGTLPENAFSSAAETAPILLLGMGVFFAVLTVNDILKYKKREVKLDNATV